MPDLSFDFNRYPYLTPHLAGTGGVLRQEIRDFQVFELPAYDASGQGEHLFLLIEKLGVTTRQVYEYIRDELRINEAHIGVAGLKDKHALTQQWISVPARYESRMDGLEELTGVRVLQTALHHNKLRVGHLRGNRFRILLRGCEPAAELRAQKVFAALGTLGVPNFFGPQRFGIAGKNPERGYLLLKSGRGRGNPWLKRFLMGSVQSLLFNAWLGQRMDRGWYDQVLLGDVAKKHLSGGEFLVEDLTSENPRAKDLQISAMGPLFGKKYFEAQHQARELEDEILAEFDIARTDFFARKGARRVLRFPLEGWQTKPDPQGLWVEFVLPKGAYATSILREVMKKNPEEPADNLVLDEE